MAVYEPLETQNGRRRLSLRSPVTMEPIGELTCATRAEVRAAVDRARAAQPAWKPARVTDIPRHPLAPRGCRRGRR